MRLIAILLVVIGSRPAFAAPTTAPTTAPSDKTWALQPLENHAVPVVADPAKVANRIDAFILARLETAGLSPAPQVDRQKLIRRLYFDLIGLPPTPAQLDDAMKDSRPDWYEHLVDQLLADKHYGERWGRHWLDVARYADSDGYENDGDRPGAYFYRDFAIRAFNDDLPYNTFLQWQLAGDELEPKRDEAHIATGFVAAALWVETVSKLRSELDKYRYDELDDMIGATGQAMLGLTINCGSLPRSQI